MLGIASIATSKPELYQELRSQLTSLLEGEPDAIANAANTAALLYNSMPDVNWVGFYFLKSNELVLGPFQGKPACVRIPLGKGVCGTAAERRQSIVVPRRLSGPYRLRFRVAVRTGGPTGEARRALRRSRFG
jgi:L-methionine (R)-S-oxide reductase